MGQRLDCEEHLMSETPETVPETVPDPAEPDTDTEEAEDADQA